MKLPAVNSRKSQLREAAAAVKTAKQRVKARTAVRRGLETQVAGRGFAFVEVLAECPLHLGLTPEQAEAWVRDEMTPVFPLGVKKDAAAAPWPASVGSSVGRGSRARASAWRA